MKLRGTAPLLVLILAFVALLFFGIFDRDTGHRDERAARDADAVPVSTSGTSTDVILRAAAASVHPGWSVVSDSTAAGGSRLANANAGAPKVTAPLASPSAYFDLTFAADAGTAYRLWIRGKAQNNSYDNDSVYVQFSDSVTSAGAAAWRIGSTSGTSIVLEDCSGCGVSGWGWQDNGYGTGVLGTPVYFASTGTHTVRIQVREDGLSIDQVVLSPMTYFSTAPGATKNDTTILTAGDTTSTPPPSSSSGDQILLATAATTHPGWSVISDTTAAGGTRLANANAGAAKIGTPLASPSAYFNLTFSANSGTPYRLWLRGKAQGNTYDNDSVYVQFSDSVTSAGTATWRIGTTSATAVNLEDCGGCGVSGWGWQDNGYGTGVLGTPVYFASTGTHTLRVQVREDGLSIDQIVLSPTTYFTTAPGALKNDTTILTGGGSTPPPTTITLVREPFLQQVTDRSAVIVWASTQSGPASVRINNQTFAATSTYFSTTTTGMSVSYYQHEALVTGLAPATTYTYDVFVGSVDANATQDQLRTSPSPGAGTVTFIAFGDSGTGSTAQRTLASRMNADTFDFAVHAGDVAYGSADGIGDASFTTYTNWFFSIYKNWLRRRPLFPSLGNHDARASNGEGRAYLSVFALPEEGGAGAFPDDAERYYSFDWGPVHVIVLDTERSLQDATRRPAQVSWATTDLSTTTQPWKVAVYHRSPYSSGAEHGSDTLVQQTFGPLFEKYGVQLAISGHDHDYERSTPWRVSTDRTQQAVTYLVTGGGGGPVYTVGKGAFTAVSKSVNHYSRITVSGCQLTIKGIDTAGATFDSWTLDRCKQDADAGPPSVRITSPGTGASVSGVTTVAVDATDDTQVEKVDLWVDGALKAIDVSAPYAFSWDATNVAAGTHLLEARAYDIAGNRVASAKVSVTR